MKYYQNIPHEKGLDHTLALLKEGYPFISNRTKKLGSDLFTTRIMGKKVICMSGPKATELFYNEALFKRSGAAPMHIKKTLFGKQSIQGLDGLEHLRRKALFMSLLSPEYEQKLIDLIHTNLLSSIKRWEQAKRINVYYESKRILFESVCAWAEVSYQKEEERQLIEDFALMIYSFGRVGALYYKGKRARKRTEHWIRDVIILVREHKLTVAKNSPLYVMSSYKDSKGKILSPQVAAVELINLLRPTIAISTYISFSALALYRFPKCKNKLKSGDSAYLEMFCEEVRRYYPFSPFTGGKVKMDFTWKGCTFKKGSLALLDIYGASHSRKLWRAPNEFNPERFAAKIDSHYSFIPQGGGNINKGHRCAGDFLTVDVMKVFVQFLVQNIEYKVPRQNLHYPLNKMPTLPESGFIINYVSKLS